MRTSIAAALADPAPDQVIEAEAAMSALLVEMRKSSSQPRGQLFTKAGETFQKFLSWDKYATLPLDDAKRGYFVTIGAAFDQEHITLDQVEKAHQLLFNLRCETSGLVQRIMLRALETAVLQATSLFGLNAGEPEGEPAPKKESELDKALGPQAAAPPMEQPVPVDKRPVQDRIQEERDKFVKNAMRTALAARAQTWCPASDSISFSKRMTGLIKTSQAEQQDVFVQRLFQEIDNSKWRFPRRWGAKLEVLTWQGIIDYFVSKFTDNVFEKLDSSIPPTKEAREQVLDRLICHFNNDLAAINEIYDVMSKETGHTASIETVLDKKLKHPGLHGKLTSDQVENEFIRKILLNFVPEISLRSFLTHKLEQIRFSKNYLILRFFNLFLALITNLIWAALFPILFLIDKSITYFILGLVKFTPVPSLIRKKFRTVDQKAALKSAYSHAINSVLLAKLKEVEASLKTAPSSENAPQSNEFVGEILSETAKGNINQLVSNLSLLLENQRFKTFCQMRTDKASQPFQSINTIF